MISSALELHNVSKQFASPDGDTITVLDLAKLVLPAGAELAVAGPSGTGKTTLLNLAAGLLLPTAGTVRVMGQAIDQLSEAQRDGFRARNIGIVFQTSNLIGGFTALENVLLPMGFADVVPRSQRRKHAQTLLDQVGLSERLFYRADQLSTGQQQRVAVARALVNQPRLILADEPTANVDYRTGLRVVDLLRAYCAEHNAALLLISHDRELLASFDQMLELRPNVIEQETREREKGRQGDKKARDTRRETRDWVAK